MSEPAAGEGKAAQVTLGLSEETHGKLVQLKDDGHFDEMRDAYRLAIAVALRDGLIDAKENRRSKTYLNAGSLDPDGALRDVIAEALPSEGQPYEVAERLGEAGVKVLWEAVAREGSLERLLSGGRLEPAPEDERFT